MHKRDQVSPMRESLAWSMEKVSPLSAGWIHRIVHLATDRSIECQKTGHCLVHPSDAVGLSDQVESLCISDKNTATRSSYTFWERSKFDSVYPSNRT